MKTGLMIEKGGREVALFSISPIFDIFDRGKFMLKNSKKCYDDIFEMVVL